MQTDSTDLSGRIHDPWLKRALIFGGTTSVSFRGEIRLIRPHQSNPFLSRSRPPERGARLERIISIGSRHVIADSADFDGLPLRHRCLHAQRARTNNVGTGTARQYRRRKLTEAVPQNQGSLSEGSWMRRERSVGSVSIRPIRFPVVFRQPDTVACRAPTRTDRSGSEHGRAERGDEEAQLGSDLGGDQAGRYEGGLPSPAAQPATAHRGGDG